MAEPWGGMQCGLFGLVREELHSSGRLGCLQPGAGKLPLLDLDHHDLWQLMG